eukprot:TRINITY_DN3535_c1_g3_i1.p1 TRINITY_DN3535_c1_g3~~TRINITY_DN3535_c1_g3_i1.p1  ORF type:complete len:100 (+),score=11.29 TRINITY_DN3535_c1_g3_i1:156-455(+)
MKAASKKWGNHAKDIDALFRAGCTEMRARKPSSPEKRARAALLCMSTMNVPLRSTWCLAQDLLGILKKRERTILHASALQCVVTNAVHQTQHCAASWFF